MNTPHNEASGYVASLSDLPLEYERDYGTAKRDVEITNVVDNPVIFGPRRVNSGFGYGTISRWYPRRCSSDW